MYISHVKRDEKGDGWFVTFEGGRWFWKWQCTYWTDRGNHFWDKNGEKRDVFEEITMAKLFDSKVDRLNKKLWSTDHPSPSMRAIKHQEELRYSAIKSHSEFSNE